jgi:hypothetical protein
MVSVRGGRPQLRQKTRVPEPASQAGAGRPAVSDVVRQGRTEDGNAGATGSCLRTWWSCAGSRVRCGRRRRSSCLVPGAGPRRTSGSGLRPSSGMEESGSAGGSAGLGLRAMSPSATAAAGRRPFVAGGRLLAAAHRGAGLSQAAVARACGRARPNWASRIETGAMRLPWAMVGRWADGLRTGRAAPRLGPAAGLRAGSACRADRAGASAADAPCAARAARAVADDAALRLRCGRGG